VPYFDWACSALSIVSWTFSDYSEVSSCLPVASLGKGTLYSLPLMISVTSSFGYMSDWSEPITRSLVRSTFESLNSRLNG